MLQTERKTKRLLCKIQHQLFWSIHDQGDKVAERGSSICEWVGSNRALNDSEVEYSVYRTEAGASFVHHIQMARGEVSSRLQSLSLYGYFGASTEERNEKGLTATKLARLVSLFRR